MIESKLYCGYLKRVSPHSKYNTYDTCYFEIYTVQFKFNFYTFIIVDGYAHNVILLMLEKQFECLFILIFQKIEASSLNTRLSGFGIHISSGMDIDNNGYPGERLFFFRFYTFETADMN